jgi:hypothetical protein
MIALIRENPYANTLNFQAYPHGNYTWRQSLFDWKWKGLPFCQAANTTIAIYNHFQICQSQQKQAISGRFLRPSYVGPVTISSITDPAKTLLPFVTLAVSIDATVSLPPSLFLSLLCGCY